MKKRIRKIFFSIRNRIIIIFFACVILPALAGLAFIIHNYSEYILETVMEEEQNVLQEISKNIDFQLESIEDISMGIYHNSIVREYLDQENYEQPCDYIYSYLNSIVNSEKYVVSAYLELNEEIYRAGYRYQNFGEYKERWQSQVLERGGRPVWIPTECLPAGYGQKPFNFALGRAINSSPGHTVGTLWLFMSVDFFEDFFKNPTFQKNETKIYLTSQDAQVVTSNEKSEIAERYDSTLFPKVRELDRGNFIYETGNEKQIIVYETSKTSGWKFITVTDQETAYSQLYYIRRIVRVLSFLFCASLVFCCYVLSVYIFKPLRTLSSGLTEVSQGDFKEIPLDGKKEDEISHLTRHYNDMVEQLQILVEEVRREEKAKNEEKIKVLSMQIGPHFVYNTLNTIKWMAVANKQKNISKMIESLVKLMVSVTYNTREKIYLKEEIELLDCYIYIQKMRYMNFEITYDIPEDLEQCLVGKLILQPFVENCILYAFQGKMETGRICVRARQMKDQLWLEVIDNGTGFDPGQMKNANTAEERMDHVGIANVAERIRLDYGEKYGIEIFSKSGEGTRILVRLPLFCEYPEVKENYDKDSDCGGRNAGSSGDESVSGRI